MVNKWMNSIKENSPSTVDIFLLGNKCNLEAVVPEQSIKEFESSNVRYFPASACTGFNIKGFETFLELVGSLIETVYCNFIY